MTIPHLHTERLLLRELRLSDIDALAEINADPEVTRYIGSGRVLSREDTWGQIAYILGHWEMLGYGIWGVESRETGELIGRVGFLEPEGWPGFELAWTLGHAHWGAGYATEAGREALRYAFSALGRRQVISLIYPENARSVRVAEKLGERLIGSTTLHGREVSVYGIDRGDFHG